MTLFGSVVKYRHVSRDLHKSFNFQGRNLASVQEEETIIRSYIIVTKTPAGLFDFLARTTGIGGTCFASASLK